MNFKYRQCMRYNNKETGHIDDMSRLFTHGEVDVQ
jgi:hypothetical protein